MPKRPYVNFKEIKEKIRLADVLKVLGLEDRFRKSGEGLVGICPISAHTHGPMPNDEQFKIGRKDGVDVWHCFGDCQRGGDVIEFVKEMTGYDNRHVRLWFADKFPDRLTLERPKLSTAKLPPTPALADPTPVPTTTPSASTTPELHSEPLKPLRFTLRLDPHAEYLRQRGIEPATIERFGLGRCSKGLLDGYIAIPIRDFPSDTLVAYMGRWAGKDYDEAAGRPRYKLPAGFPVHRVIYGLTEALESATGTPLIVVEGPFKVFHLYQHGFPNTVSCLTASVSDEQVAILAATCRPIILFFDGNGAGYRGMRNAAGKLITQTFVKCLKLPEGQEPDDLSREELARLLTTA